MIPSRGKAKPSFLRFEALRGNDRHHFELHHQVRMGEADNSDEALVGRSDLKYFARSSFTR
jgi:hypothetical protein